MNSYRRITSVKTACEILEFLSEQDGPVSVLEISKTLEIPQGTVLCHLSTLEDSQFVAKVSDKYELGPCLATIWASYRSKLQAKIGGIQKELHHLEVN